MPSGVLVSSRFDVEAKEAENSRLRRRVRELESMCRSLGGHVGGGGKDFFRNDVVCFAVSCRLIIIGGSRVSPVS